MEILDRLLLLIAPIYPPLLRLLYAYGAITLLVPQAPVVHQAMAALLIALCASVE